MKEGWERKTLGDLFNVGSSKRVLKSQWKAEGVPFYRGREITRLGAQGFVENDLFISEKHFAELSKKYGVPRKGDIMMTAIGTIGNTHVVRESDRFYFKDASVLWLERAVELDSDYINYWIKSPWFYEQLDVGNGATVDTLTISKVRSLEVDLPPLAEQQRIVGILDEAFAGLATAKANAEKNLQNARALFESHLQSVFTQDWQAHELVTLADLATDITDGDHQPPPKSTNGVPFITIGNIDKKTREISFKDTFMVPLVYFKALKPYKKPRRGDVLYTVTGSFGIPVIVPDDTEFCFQRHIGLIRPRPETNSDWLYYLLLSPQLIRQANEGATGTAQKTVSLKLLRSFVVPKVPLSQQKQAVEKLGALSKETQRLTAIYTRKLAALEELKKALLHQAFSGQL